MSAGAAWYLVHTRPHAEEKAAYHLERQSFGVFLPRYRKRRCHARRIETVIAPLFPRYLFVAIDLAIDRWRSINSTIGVSSLICHAGLPDRVPDAVMQGLMARTDASGLLIPAPRPSYLPGQRVRLLKGAFVDLIGFFEHMSDQDRVSVLLELMGRKVRVMLEIDEIEPAA